MSKEHVCNYNRTTKTAFVIASANQQGQAVAHLCYGLLHDGSTHVLVSEHVLTQEGSSQGCKGGRHW